MPNFIVNKNAQSADNNEHEVHNTTNPCSYMPATHNQLDLGWHTDCHGAVKKAKETYSNSNGCAYCCPDCHTG